MKLHSIPSTMLALVLALTLLPAPSAGADWSPGSLDTGFDITLGPNGSVNAIAVQPDGKVLIGGSFTWVGPYSWNHIGRLNADGSADTSFNPGTGADGTVSAVALQPDGKILIGGSFGTVDGSTRSKIARLNADGSLDTAFDPGAGADGTVNAIAVQSDGASGASLVLIGGGFDTVDSMARNGLARLNADGSLDTNFVPTITQAASDAVQAVAVQPNGAILIGGEFTQVGGASRNRIARLQPNGSLDTTFTPGSGADGTVNGLALQQDGQVVIVGAFTAVSGTARGHVARLNASGGLDTTFDPGSGANTSVYAVAVQSDGRVLVGGIFNMVDGTARNSLARLGTDGSLDATFVPAIGTATFDGVWSLALQADGKILAGGSFVEVDGIECDHLARLHPDGSLDAAPNIDLGPDDDLWALALQPDGKVLIGGGFATVDGAARSRVARLNTNGALDPTFNTTITGGTNDQVEAIAVQTDSKVLIGGWFWYVDGVSRHRIARLNADGSLDTTFDPGNGTDSVVRAVALQADGKVLIGGDFSTVDGTARARIARLNTDGSLDTTFDPGTGADGEVWAVAVQSNGKMLIGGSFATVGGTARARIARLNADGSLDTTFNPGTGADGTVYTLALQSDGKVLIGGGFYTVDGTARSRIARLNAGGSLDTAFDPGTGADFAVMDLALQADGKVLIAGNFGTVDGTARGRIARLNAGGSLDTTFDPGTGAEGGQVNAVVIQADGKLIIGGKFTHVDGTAKNYVARLNANGSLDSDFGGEPGPNNMLYDAAVQSDGKVIVAGAFTTVDGQVCNRIARLNANLSLDTAFDPGTGASNRVRTVVPLSNGQLLIGGDFTTINGITCNRVARLNADGVVDTAFDTSVGADGIVYALAAQSDGQAIIGGAFATVDGQPRAGVARLNTDGALDTGFDPGSGANGTVYAVALQPDGKVLLGGDFTTIDGTTRRRIARLNTDGSLDTSFNPGSGANGTVYALALQPDGDSGASLVVIGGEFSTVDGTARAGIARLKAGGGLDAGFDPGAGAGGTIRDVAVQSDDQVLVGGDFTTMDGAVHVRVARLNADGSLDTGFDTGTGADATVYVVVPQADGRVLIGGSFTNVNDTSRNRIARLHGATPPVITSGAPPTSAKLGMAYSHTYTATGFPAPTFWHTGGTLPPGLTIDRITGMLSGIPTAAGSYAFTTGACNGVAPCGTQAANLTVAKGDTVTTISAHAPHPSAAGQAVTVSYILSTAAGTPTGNVTVHATNGGTASCTATVAVGRCTLTLPTPGVWTLVAAYAGDANYTGSASAAVTHTVADTFVLFLPIVEKNH